MSGARDHLDPPGDRKPATGTRRTADIGPGPSIAGGRDPRLAHGGAGAALLHLQRVAGNAAVGALVGPTVQREVTIDEIATDVMAPQGPHPDPGQPQDLGGGGDGGWTPGPHPDPGQPQDLGGGPVTSDGATTTISGGTINLEAAITQTSGIIRAGTIIADNVVGSNYTPGAGNVW